MQGEIAEERKGDRLLGVAGEEEALEGPLPDAPELLGEGRRVPLLVVDAGDPQDDAGRVVPLLDGVSYVFLSATMTKDAAHPASAWFGDLLVLVPSASGPIHEPFPIHTATFGGVLHHQIQVHPDVYAQVLRACRDQAG